MMAFFYLSAKSPWFEIRGVLQGMLIFEFTNETNYCVEKINFPDSY